MKTWASISIVFFTIQTLVAQENIDKKDVIFENPDTKEQIKIETGDGVVIRFKVPNMSIIATVVSLSDSSLILAIDKKPYPRQIVPFRNISDLTKMAPLKKKYNAQLTLKTGKKLTGQLVRLTADSLSIRRGLNDIRLGASEIAKIQIGKKRAGLTLGICAAAGGLIGLIIGVVTAPTKECSGGLLPCNDVPQFDNVPGSVLIGGVAGLGVGLLIAPIGREIKIEGSREEFYLFSNEFKNKIQSTPHLR